MPFHGLRIGVPGSLGVVSGFPAPGAIIDEIFTTGQYFPRAIATELVDTRSTTKFVTNAAGLMSSVAINTLPISNAGMLVEPAATNLMLQSGSLSTAPWAAGAITVAAPTVTANATAGPDGNVTATRLDFPAVSAAGSVSVLSGGVSPGAVSTPVSLYLKGAVGGEAVYIILVDDSAFAYFRLLCTLTTSWQRFSFTCTPAAVHQNFEIGVDLRDAGQTSKPAQAIFAQFAQVEAGAAPSSYIPTTTAAASRSADSIAIQRTGIDHIVFTFDDNSQQTISGIDPATQFTIPTNLNRPLVKRMTGYGSSISALALLDRAGSLILDRSGGNILTRV